MAERDVIAIGASAGGLEALQRVVGGLPPGLPAALFIVVHHAPYFESVLPEILGRGGPLPASHARDGEEIRPGHIYVAPQDRHLLLQVGAVAVRFGPKVNRFRPAIGPLLRTAADAYGSRAVGVLLSGGMTDGVAGLLAVKRVGGVTVVQDPADAIINALPYHAISTVEVDHIVPASEMGKLLGQLAREPADEGTRDMPDTISKAEEATQRDFAAQERGERVGQVSMYSCPHCGGVLRQTDETRLAEFLCHVGHAYEGESLLKSQAEMIETSAWNLLRALKEQALLARELARMARRRGDAAVEARLASSAERQVHLIQEGLLKDPGA
jgi:two-component system chemotaxis response regulator CheB